MYYKVESLLREEEEIFVWVITPVAVAVAVARVLRLYIA